VPEQEHIFSASEIEDYKLCPKKYSEKHVTSIPNKIQFVSDAEENGSTRGLIIHEIFQGKDPSTVLKRYGIFDSDKEKLYRGFYDSFMSSDFMKDVKEDHKELPFLARIDGILFSGKIDRVAKKCDGSWNIIDYKTSFLSKDQMKEKARDFSYQLAIYRSVMQQLLAEEICVFAYFTSIERFFEVELDDKILRLNIKKIVQKINSKDFSFDCCNGCSRQSMDKIDGLCPALKDEIDITY
jgi:hypothetical protein